MAKLIIDYPVERDALLYVMSEDCKPKGWRVDMLVEKLSSKLEEKVLLCSCCNGMLRDACFSDGALMCQVCIPEAIVVQPVVMNREIVNEKIVSCLLLIIIAFLNLRPRITRRSYRKTFHPRPLFLNAYVQ